MTRKVIAAFPAPEDGSMAALATAGVLSPAPGPGRADPGAPGVSPRERDPDGRAPAGGGIPVNPAATARALHRLVEGAGNGPPRPVGSGLVRQRQPGPAAAERSLYRLVEGSGTGPRRAVGPGLVRQRQPRATAVARPLYRLVEKAGCPVGPRRGLRLERCCPNPKENLEKSAGAR